jgi:hypothetical protein
MKKLTAHRQDPWIGVDLDGTLALVDYERPYDYRHIGEPVPLMLKRVLEWKAQGKRVKIFTARVAGSIDIGDVVHVIHQWCIKHGLGYLEITATKDGGMEWLWDDRAVGVIRNTGRVAPGPK